MPVKVLRSTDRFKVSIGKTAFFISPLKKEHKFEIMAQTKRTSGDAIENLEKSSRIYIKHALKDVKGFVDYHGNPYKLSFEDDRLTDDCVEEVISMSEDSELISCCMQIINRIPDKIIDFTTGEKMKGVKLEVMKPIEGSG